MNLTVTDAQARELRVLLEDSLREMSHEIAATDNAAFRSGLVDRRRLLSEVADELGRLVVHGAAADADVLVREMAHPGD